MNRFIFYYCFSILNRDAPAHDVHSLDIKPWTGMFMICLQILLKNLLIFFLKSVILYIVRNLIATNKERS